MDVDRLAEQIMGKISRGVICITGNGCAGKTTLAKKLVEALPDAGHYSFDGLTIPSAMRRNLTDHGELVTGAHPLAVDEARAKRALSLLKKGEAVPVYTEHNQSALREEDGVYRPKRYTVIEGLAVLQESLLPFYGFIIFIECDEQTEWKRRKERDMRERNITSADMHAMFKLRRRQYEQYVARWKDRADVIIQ